MKGPVRAMHLKLYPATILYALNAIIALVVSFGFLSSATAHYVTVVATAVLGLVVAFLTKPVVVPVAAAAFAAILTGIGGFGLHLTDAQVAAATVVFSMLAAFFTHQSVIPNAASRQGGTAAEIEARTGRLAGAR